MSRISGRPAITTQNVYGLSLRVARWREGAPGTPLLFLNGIGADIVAAAPLPYGAPTIAAVVMEIADRLGHKSLDLAGFSWGGALAQQIAIQFPGRVRRLG